MISIKSIVLILILALIDYGVSFTAKTPMALCIQRVSVHSSSSLLATTEEDKNNREAEELQAEINKAFGNQDSDQLQAELNKLVEDPPMFSGWSSDNFDEDALPIPAFTAAIISVGSIIFTGYLFNIGINGFPDSPPTI